MDLFLALKIPDESRSTVQRWIRESRVRVNHEPALRASRRLKIGDRVDLSIPPRKPATIPAQARALDIRFEDPHLLILNKPAPLVVHPGAGHPDRTLVNALLAHAPLSSVGGVERPGIVHRLDKETSGLMLVAKTDAAHRALVEQFKARSIEKWYDAIVWGFPTPATGRIDTAYGRHPINRKKFSSRVSRGKRAITRYRTVRSGARFSWLECLLETGRTHQIRVHLSDRGHPIYGDSLYGGRRGESVERHALHARRLRLAHPITGAELQIEAEAPPFFHELDTWKERGSA